MKWPQLETWSLISLLKLEASWNQICPDSPEEVAAHAASMAELAQHIAAKCAERQSSGGVPTQPAV